MLRTWRQQTIAGRAGKVAAVSPLLSDPFSSLAGRTGKELAEQLAESRSLFGGEPAEGLSQDAVQDLPSSNPQFGALGGQPVPDGPTGPANPLDQAAALHASGEGAEGLVGLERQQGKVVEGGSWVLVQMTQGVPLHKADVKGGQRRVGLSVVPHLQPLQA
jgi:hypothetical protein